MTLSNIVDRPCYLGQFVRIREVERSRNLSLLLHRLLMYGWSIDCVLHHAGLARAHRGLGVNAIFSESGQALQLIVTLVQGDVLHHRRLLCVALLISYVAGLGDRLVVAIA